MPLISANKSKIVGWKSATATLSDTFFNNVSNSLALSIDLSGNVRSFQVGRPSFTQTLTQLVQNQAYLLTPKEDLILLSSDVAGFGSTSPSPSPNPIPSPGLGYQIGTNLNGISDFSTALPFTDAFRSSRSWIAGDSSNWEVSGATIPYDSSGNATHIPIGATHIKTLMFWDMGFNYIGNKGNYVVLYTGSGNISYSGNVSKVSSTAGRDVITINPGTNFDGVILYINRTNGNPSVQETISIRNIRVIPLSNELNYANNPFNVDYLNRLQRFHTLRFMDWLGINNSGQSSWANRPKLTDARWTPASIELCVDLCNTMNKDGWFCIPHQATDEYITQMATIVRDRLNSNLKVIVEYSNEVWNWQFSQAHYALAQGQALWGNNVGDAFMQYLGMKTVQIRRIWRSVWGSQANRVNTILCSQAGYIGLESAALNASNWVSSGQGVSNPVAPKNEIDSYGIAPYFDADMNSANNVNTILGWIAEGETGIQKAFQQLRNGTFFNGASFEGIKPWVAHHKNVANTIGKPLLLYECGQHLTEPYGGTDTQKAQIVEFFKLLNRRAEMGTLYLDYFIYFRNVGVQTAVHFSDFFSYSKYGYWGIWETMNVSSTAKANAVLQAINTLSGT